MPSDSNASDGFRSADSPRYHKRDFWSKENLKHVEPHYRLLKSARLISKIAGKRECDLLDVGCGPATLMQLLPPNIHYSGIDIAIHEPAPNLIEADVLGSPIIFRGQHFDIVVALGLFEYLGNFQEQKFQEISEILNPRGRFIVSYTNFAHRKPQVYWAYSNVHSIDDFRDSLGRHFVVERYFPTAFNWNHGLPNRRLIKAANMYVNVNIPVVSPRLGVEYYFVCSRREV